MSDPLISVIIPVYRVEAYIRQCLDSIISQTYYNLEIILIDDGSPDNCGIICDEYAANDQRIVVIHKKNGGLSAARNDGIAKAKGDWIAFVDSDDWLEADYYKQLMNTARGKTLDVVMAGGYYKEFSAKQKKVKSFRKPCFYNSREGIQKLQADLMTTGLPWDKLYNADFLKHNNINFDDDVKALEDYLFNFQVYEKALNVSINTIIGYHYRQSEASIAHGFNPDKPRILYDAISKLYEFVSKNDAPKQVKDGINSVAIFAVYVAMNSYFFHPANEVDRHEIQKELYEMLELPFFHVAIHSRSSINFTKKQVKQVVLKFALKTRREKLLRALFSAYQKYTT